MRYYKVLKNAKNSLSKNAIFVVTYEGTFSGSAKMTPDFRKCAPVMCRIDENAITAPTIFHLLFKNRKKISLYMRELDSVQQVTHKMHK